LKYRYRRTKISRKFGIGNAILRRKVAFAMPKCDLTFFIHIHPIIILINNYEYIGVAMKILKTKTINFLMYSLLCMLLSQTNIAVAGNTSASCRGHTCDCNKPLCITKGFKFGHEKSHVFRLNCKKPYPNFDSFSTRSAYFTCSHIGKQKDHRSTLCTNNSDFDHTLHLRIHCKK